MALLAGLEDARRERPATATQVWVQPPYELGTNRLLYFTKKYELVYTDNDLLTHYAFQSGFGVAEAIAEYEQRAEPRAPAPNPSPERVREIVAALDSQGRWLTGGSIESRTFNGNVRLLCEFLDFREDR